MIRNPLELYQHLNQSNCRRCLLPSCMAFSVSVIQGRKSLSDCPLLTEEKINELSGGILRKKSIAEEQGVLLAALQKKINRLKLADIAWRLNLPIRTDTVGVKCLGKYFWIDADGEMTSECHRNNWVHIPILHYLLQSKAAEPAGNWIPFPAIQDARGREQFFSRRCEHEMRRLADRHTDLFFELLDLFEAEEVHGIVDADRSLLLHPLPGVPFLINYWKPEESFDSKLNILFDMTVSENTNVESVYILGRGLVEMFEQLILQHTGGTSL